MLMCFFGAKSDGVCLSALSANQIDEKGTVGIVCSLQSVVPNLQLLWLRRQWHFIVELQTLISSLIWSTEHWSVMRPLFALLCIF